MKRATSTASGWPSHAVVAGDADVLMKGLVSTDKYMRGILNKDAGLFPPEGCAEPRGHSSKCRRFHKLLLHLGRRGDPARPTSSRNRS